MMCQCRFLDCNKRTILMGDVDTRGGCHMQGARDTWGLYFLLGFVVNLKLL